MNFLAHLYLSGSNVDIRLGNFIGDHVKGNQIHSYPHTVQVGIKLHRRIDQVTDRHEAWKNCKEILRPCYGRWSGVATDVMFDYILAKEWNTYSSRQLKGFTRTFYFQMLQRYHLLPSAVRGFLPFMIQSNRLYSYSTDEGIIRALEIMGNYTTMQGNPRLALSLVKENYTIFSWGLKDLMETLVKVSEKEYGISISMPHSATHRSGEE
ncbi:MAG: ACP phosphodiesterase [Bacteroidota bacterium]